MSDGKDWTDLIEPENESLEDFDEESHQTVVVDPQVHLCRESNEGCSGLWLWNSSGGTYPLYFSDCPRLGYNSQLLNSGILSDSVDF